MSEFRTASLALAIVVSATLSGCVAVALAPLVPLAGGMMPSDNKVVIDEASVTPELRTSLSKANKLTFVGMDASDTYMAEYLDKQRAFDVELEEAPKGSTPSQRRKLMQTICTRKDRPDLVLSSSSGESDAGMGTTVKGMFLGRADAKLVGTVEVLRCRDNWKTQFTARIEMSQGIFNADQTRLAQLIGHEAAKALMQVAGKSPAPTVVR